MSKFRLLYLSTSLNMGGSEKFLATVARRLKNEHDVSVGYLKEKGVWGELLEKEGFPVRRFASVGGLAYYLKSNSIDILHSFLYRANIMGRLAAKLAGTPAVISTQQAIDVWKSPFLVWLDRVTSPWCDVVLVNSLAAKRSAASRERFPERKIEVIHNGIGGEFFSVEKSRKEKRLELGIREDRFVAICVMRLHREKGADFIPRIAAGAGQSFFLIVGEGPERGVMEREIRERGLEARCRFLGWRQDIPELLKAADAFLLPSREESFPQAILEAMALGLPVIAADIGGVRELVEEEATGILVPTGNVDGFSQALTRLVRHPDEAKSMGERGRARSLAFGETGMIEKIDGLYRRLLTA